MGLTAATLLLDLGLNVTIYSDRKPADTTSAKAGGQWAVSVVEFQGKERELADIIKTAFTTFKNSIGGGFGVSAQPNYTRTRSHNLDVVLQLVPGLIPPPVALARFSHLIGYHRAAEMILTGRRFSARAAQAMGLINRVLAANQFAEGLQALVDELLGKSGAVLRIALKGLRELALEGLDQALKRSEEIYCRELLSTEDVEEGIKAFLEKRQPQWRHR